MNNIYMSNRTNVYFIILFVLFWIYTNIGISSMKLINKMHVRLNIYIGLVAHHVVLDFFCRKFLRNHIILEF